MITDFSRKNRHAALCTFAVWAGLAVQLPQAQAQSLTLPGQASLQIREDSAASSYDVPVNIWADGILPVITVEGNVTREAWRLAGPALTSLQILRPLREQLQNDRFRIIFECQTEACGGFDFRFATATLPPPEMQINLGDFRFLSAQRDSAAGREYATLFISATAQAGFVQITRVAPTSAPALQLATPDDMLPVLSGGDSLAIQLETNGRAILPDLEFATGSAVLQDQAFESLAGLAGYLDAFPARSVALVGHTDSSGDLDQNIALSRRRAGAVLERLVSDYDVDRRQLAAEGMGYLAPVASNRTAAGRELNRRVEVIITSTQ